MVVCTHLTWNTQIVLKLTLSLALAEDNSLGQMKRTKQSNGILSASIILINALAPALAQDATMPGSTKQTGQASAGEEASQKHGWHIGPATTPSEPVMPATSAPTPGTSGSSSASAKTSLSKPTTKASTFAVEPKPVPGSARIAIMPFLVADHPCTFSVLDADGKPIGNAGVYLDDELYCSSSTGFVTIVPPNSETFELSLMGDGKRKIAKMKFIQKSDKVFAENEKLAETAAAVLRSDASSSSSPTLSFCPSVVSPGENFVLLGQKLSDKISDLYVDIDGSNAPVVSSSQDGLLAIAPNKLSLGPLRELFVTVSGQASNVTELDISTPFFNHAKVESDDVSPEKGKIGMNGTNVPCLIRVRNLDIDSASLWSPKQEPLGKNNVLLSPGGEQNYLSIDVRRISAANSPKVELALEHEFPSSADLQKGSPQLLQAAARADIMRIARRKISAEFRLEELRKKQNGLEQSNNLDSERSASESKALSLRLGRISRMLAARRAIFESFGATDTQYRQALDDAAGGAMLNLDLATKPIQIISDGGVSLASGLTGNSASVSARKGRPLRLLEPVIRLLPPMDESQLAVFNALNANNATAANASNKNAASQSDGNSSDQPQLRPGLPEPEPEVSESARGSTLSGKPKSPIVPVKKPSNQDSEKQNASAETGAKTEKKKPTDSKTKQLADEKSSSKSKSKSKSGSKNKGKQSKEPEQPAAKKGKHKRKPTKASSQKSGSGKHRRHRRHS